MATKIQSILLVDRSSEAGAGSASSVGRIGMGRRRSSLRLGPEMATIASSLGEAGKPYRPIIRLASYGRHRHWVGRVKLG